MTSHSTPVLLLTQRALKDLRDIEAYSVKHFGRKTAARYLDDLESGLQRVLEDPGILEIVPDLHPALRFYRVRKHLFACDVQSNSIVVLTVIHVSMDIPQRLSELQPSLTREIEILHKRIAGEGR